MDGSAGVFFSASAALRIDSSNADGSSTAAETSALSTGSSGRAGGSSVALHLLSYCGAFGR
jgi:hypothetical protein